MTVKQAVVKANRALVKAGVKPLRGTTKRDIESGGLALDRLYRALDVADDALARLEEVLFADVEAS